MAPSILDSFPWQCLDTADDDAGEPLVRWINTHFAAHAYQAFLELGRGLLVGPFLTDEGKNPISSQEALRRHQDRIPIGLSITYVAADDPLFERTLPDPALRAALREAIGAYLPESECIILILADNTPHRAQIVGAQPSVPLASLRMSYEALFHASEARLPN